jgi:hypothetical protein
VLDADAAIRAVDGCRLVYDCLGLPADQMHLHPAAARNIAKAIGAIGARCITGVALLSLSAAAAASAMTRALLTMGTALKSKVRVGEVGQTKTARRVLLPEDDILFWAGQRPPTLPARRALLVKRQGDAGCKYCTSSPAGQPVCEEVATLRGDRR